MVVLDCKLTFKPHIEQIIRNLIAITWSAYTRYQKVTYGTMILWPEIEMVSTTIKLKCLQSFVLGYYGLIRTYFPVRTTESSTTGQKGSHDNLQEKGRLGQVVKRLNREHVRRTSASGYLNSKCKNYIPVQSLNVDELLS